MTERLEQIAGTMEVRDTHRFEVAALERYMREHVAGFAGHLTVRQFMGGQSNPTYHLRSDGQEYVLRRKPPGKLLPSAHAVDREYRVISALAGTGVPVPRSYALCEDPDVIGTAFYIMGYVPGRVLVDPRLPGVAPAERAQLYDAMNAVLARLPLVAWHAVGPGEFGRPGRAAIEDWDFYVGFAMFRLAAIAQGIMGRVLAGTANDPNARQRGERARPLADAAWELISSRAARAR